MEMATRADGRKTKGITLPCPHCGDLNDGTGLTLALADGELSCPACGETVRRSDLDWLIGEARRALALLDAFEQI